MEAINTTCPKCHVGKFNQKRITTFPALEGHTIMVPNVPVWQCDICGWSQFEPEVAQWLDQMTKRSQGKAGQFPQKTQADLPDENDIWKVV